MHAYACNLGTPASRVVKWYRVSGGGSAGVARRGWVHEFQGQRHPWQRTLVTWEAFAREHVRPLLPFNCPPPAIRPRPPDRPANNLPRTCRVSC